MGSVAGTFKVHHAVQAGVGGAITLIAVGIEFLLGENISAALHAAVGGQQQSSSGMARGGVASGVTV